MFKTYMQQYGLVVYFKLLFYYGCWWQGELFVEQSSGGLWSEENLVGGKHDVMKAKKNEEDQSLIFIVMLAWTVYLKVFDLP